MGNAEEKVLLFDFDGTIADSMQAVVDIFNELVPLYSLPRTIGKDDIHQLRNLHIKDAFRLFGIPPLKIPFLLFEGKKKFAERISQLKPIPGMKEVILELKNQHITLGIVTSNATKNVETFLKENSLEVFDFIYSEKGLFGKAKVLKHVMKKYNISPQNCLYVGDEIRDIEASQKVGLRIISVTWGANTKEALEKAKPDFLVNNPPELLRLLTSNN